MKIEGLSELRGTQAFRRLLRNLEEMASHADSQTIEAARSLPVEDVRFRAGVATGIRQVVSVLEQR